MCSSLPFIGRWTTNLEEPPTFNGLDDIVFPWLYYLCQQAYSFVATGWLDAVVNLTNWATNTVCCAVLGEPTCASMLRTLIITAASVCLLTLWYLFDLLFKPVLRLARIGRRGWLYLYGTSDDGIIQSTIANGWAQARMLTSPTNSTASTYGDAVQSTRRPITWSSKSKDSSHAFLGQRAR